MEDEKNIMKEKENAIRLKYSAWKGRELSEMSREELIVAFHELAMYFNAILSSESII